MHLAMDSRSLVEYSDDEEAVLALPLDDDCEEDYHYARAREGDGGASSVVASLSRMSQPLIIWLTSSQSRLSLFVSSICGT